MIKCKIRRKECKRGNMKCDSILNVQCRMDSKALGMSFRFIPLEIRPDRDRYKIHVVCFIDIRDSIYQVYANNICLNEEFLQAIIDSSWIMTVDEHSM